MIRQKSAWRLVKWQNPFRGPFLFFFCYFCGFFNLCICCCSWLRVVRFIHQFPHFNVFCLMITLEFAEAWVHLHLLIAPFLFNLSLLWFLAWTCWMPILLLPLVRSSCVCILTSVSKFFFFFFLPFSSLSFLGGGRLDDHTICRRNWKFEKFRLLWWPPINWSVNGE